MLNTAINTMQAKSPSFSERLTALLQERGLSPGAIAAKVGVSRSYLSQVLNGHRPLSAKIAGKVAAALDVSPSWIFFGEQSATSNDPANGDIDRHGVALHYLLSEMPNEQIIDLLRRTIDRLKDKPFELFAMGKLLCEEGLSREKKEAAK